MDVIIVPSDLSASVIRKETVHGVQTPMEMRLEFAP
jgi:hypothetical protein